MTVDAVRLLLEEGREVPLKYFRLDGRPHLQGRVVAPPQLAPVRHPARCGGMP